MSTRAEVIRDDLANKIQRPGRLERWQRVGHEEIVILLWI
jgi:hypothetical protein